MTEEQYMGQQLSARLYLSAGGFRVNMATRTQGMKPISYVIFYYN